MAIDFKTLTLYFLYSLIVGAGIGVIYDVFRIVRIILPKAKAVIFVEDILFCLTAGVIMSIFIFNAGFGIVRGYALVGAGLGFTAYYMTIGKLVYRLFGIIIDFISKALRFLAAIIAAPILAAARLTVRIVKSVASAVRLRMKLWSTLRSANNGFGLARG